jgi:hypothetical protein
MSGFKPHHYRFFDFTGEVLDLLKGFGTELFGTERTVLSAFTNRAPASGPSYISGCAAFG